MSHRFVEGRVYHKRFVPIEHTFTYGFYLLDIDTTLIEALSSKRGFLKNIMRFDAKDHFGKGGDFKTNIQSLLAQFNLAPTPQMRFLTLPRIFGFVFNPLSVLMLFDEGIPRVMLAEVHNYNGGRIVYKVELMATNRGEYEGSCPKDMYVSPFFDRTGRYDFSLRFDDEEMALSVTLFENEQKSLVAAFTGKFLPYTPQTRRALLCRHTWLTLWVVTRTLWQTLRLKFKGLPWHNPQAIDTKRRY